MNSVLYSDILESLKNKSIFQALNNSTVLITGITGLIGSVLAKTLLIANRQLDLNISVIGIARNKDKANKVFEELIEDEKLKILFTTNYDEVKCDYIIHTISPTASHFFVSHPVETIETSINETKKVLDFSKNTKVKKVVYLSSMEEYGVPYSNQETMTEDKVGIINHLSPRSCYPESKRLCECMCCSYYCEYDVPVTIARLAQTFGAGVNIEDTRVFMQFSKSLINKQNIVLHTEGRSLSNFCYLTDAVIGIFLILLKGQPAEAYNVCFDEETRSIKEIAELLVNEFDTDLKVIIEIPNNQNMGYAPDTTIHLDSTKLKNLGWGPKVTTKEAYKRLMSYIIEEE